MNLNADLGEGAGADEEILPQIDSANIACGVYAGSVSISIATAQLCRQLNVEIGAHPGSAVVKSGSHRTRSRRSSRFRWPVSPR